ncbi:MAG TPA: transglutaminase domain-containing protein [Candidatus Dormibacteraeota bacterium]|nr:transglutaminase domain-containing protein [Candidatus Dormibacteraeota bacterium]
MQSVSPRGSLQLGGIPSGTWERTRAAVPPSTLWSAVLVLALALTIARSTVTAAWVQGGIEGIPFVAMGAAVLMTGLAVSRLPTWLCIALGAIAGPIVGIITTGPAFRAAYPGDPTNVAGLVQVWTERVFEGSAFGDQAFVGLVITLLMWVTGGWLAWCVVRWRQPLIGLIPGAAAFSTNVLNTANQQGYTFIFLALTLGLLLWTTYTSSVEKAVAARIKMTGDARWDFWETGLVATAALLVVGIMLPPISTTDRTATMESSVFDTWGKIQQQLNQIGVQGNGPVPGQVSTGFSADVSMGPKLTQSTSPVFTYSLTAGPYPGPYYFRGLNDTVTTMVNGEPTWTYGSTERTQAVAANDPPPFAEQYRWLALGSFTINMLLPPGRGSGDIYFYPGQLYIIDKSTVVHETQVPPSDEFGNPLVTIDRLTAAAPAFSSKGQYNVTVGYPDVTADELRAAGTDYLEWLAPYSSLPAEGYRSASALKFIHDLAVSITANYNNPYDKAAAIEAYLRDPTKFKYTLQPTQPKDGTDREVFFLNTSHDGYCQYFAMAMGDMLRSLGIPTRLVSGFGPGAYVDTLHTQVVRDEDAHVWVESYFPGYGWVPFEPTRDGVYNSITRTSTRTSLCFTDNHCTSPPPILNVVTSPVVRTTPSHKDVGNSDQPTGPNQSSFRWLDSTMLTRIAGVLGALLLLLIGLGARYLRPRTVMGVWRRVLVLARLAGAELQPGETPSEMDRRLGRAFPEAAPHLHSLTDAFVVAAYAPPEMAEATKPSVMEAWATLRPIMLRRVISRARPGRG